MHKRSAVNYSLHARPLHCSCMAHRSTLTHPKAADSWRPKVCKDQKPRLPLKQYLHGVTTNDVCSRCLQCKASGRSVEALNHISLQQYDDCELLWLHYRHQLSISKTAAFWALQDIQRGTLPCDAEVLRSRASQFAALGQQQQVPGLDALRVINSSRHALHQEPEKVRQALMNLMRLLPGHAPTQLLLNVLADLDVPSEILALQHQEVDAAFRATLGSHMTPTAFHHVLQHTWRRQQHEQEQRQLQAGGPSIATPRASEQQQQQLWPAAMPNMPQQQVPDGVLQVSSSPATAGTAGVTHGGGGRSTHHLREQLTGLAQVFGPEVVHTAVCNTPELLDVQPTSLLPNLQWLQQQLQMSPVAAVLLAETAGAVLMLPNSVLEARYSNLCYLLQQLLGWRLRQVHTLLCNAPQLLACDSARLASNWQAVQQLARRRSSWLEELAGASQSLVVTVLSAKQHQLQQLRYAADARELQGYGVVQVLRLDYTDFLHMCPGFRVWRGLVQAEQRRWSLVEEECIVSHDSITAGQPMHQHGKVLAVDGRGQPTLIKMGTLGPYDRLIG